MSDTARDAVRKLAAEYQAAGNHLGWFEPVYQSAAGATGAIPWADLKPNHNLTDWLDANPNPIDSSVLVVGCGLGDDAEELARRGMNVTAFDIAPTAIEWCYKRFPVSKVRYEVKDLLALPETWRAKFDLVVEIYTLQTLPAELRIPAMQGLAATLASEGKLLIVCRGREPEEPKGSLPWPLTRAEFDPLRAMLDERSFEDYMDGERDPVRRFRVVYQRP
jgi:SAM-dependent methyltransferase